MIGLARNEKVHKQRIQKQKKPRKIGAWKKCVPMSRYTASPAPDGVKKNGPVKKNAGAEKL